MNASSDWRRGVTYTVRPDPGPDYRIMVSLRRQAAKGEEFSGYESLRQRALAIAAKRVARQPARTWISGEGRHSIEMADRQLIFVWVTMCTTATPGRYDEIYIDFEHGETDIDLFSYGEYVPSAADVDFAPFVERAEAIARYHYGPELRVERRECFCATHPDVAVVHVFFRI